MKSFLKTALWLSIWVLATEFAAAQSCCLGSTCTCNQKDLSPAGVEIGMRHQQGMWMFSYTCMNTQWGGNLSGASPVSNMAIYNNYLMAPTTMNMDMHMLMAMYGVTNRFTLMAMGSYSFMNMKMIGLPGKVMIMNPDGTMYFENSSTSQEMVSKSSGIGDTKLYGIYSFYVHRGTSLMGSLGVSIPTGSISVMGNAEDMYLGRHLPYGMQLGSGTFDLLPGITYLHNSADNNFEYSAQVTAKLRTYNNAYNYHLGNSYTADAWAAYQFFKCLSPTVRVEATTTNAVQGNDVDSWVIEPAGSPANYGGQIVNGYVGLSYYFRNVPIINNSRILVEYGVPLYQFVNGIQLATKSALNASWRFAF